MRDVQISEDALKDLNRGYLLHQVLTGSDNGWQIRIEPECEVWSRMSGATSLLAFQGDPINPGANSDFVKNFTNSTCHHVAPRIRSLTRSEIPQALLTLCEPTRNLATIRRSREMLLSLVAKPQLVGCARTWIKEQTGGGKIRFGPCRWAWLAARLN